MEKTLIVIPGAGHWGGVTSFYANLRPYWKEDVEIFEYLSSRDKKNLFSTFAFFFKNNIAFIRELQKKKITQVCLNPSMGITALLRDGTFLLIAKFLHKKVIVFNHGWNVNFVPKLEKYWLPLYKSIFFRADAFILLAQEFSDKIRQWGFRKKIFLITTQVTDEFWERAEKKISIQDDIFRILFLARVEKAKGIRETLEAYHLLQQRHPEKKIELICAGAGPELEYWKQYASDQKIPAVFPGVLKGQELDKIYCISNCYILPSHTEGLPLTVLEAMTWRLPIIIHLVGGLKDLFQSPMGYGTESLSPVIYADFLEKILQQDCSRMGAFNRNYVKDNLLSSIIYQKITKIFHSMNESNQ